MNKQNSATLKFIRLSSTKARLIAREIQGMNAELAIASLDFTPNKAARVIAKVVASAVANAGLEAENATIYSCVVEKGPVLKRFIPRARGSATPIHKPTSHIFVEVKKQEGDNNGSKS
ncbi:MAG: 50S ribosomal protein L22 [Campylobacteraceae bacterium 4484_166]|nr:MAG: 50S ribosomal protein L22 [Campylobacteraceae bacterium 4484_166]